MALNITFDGYAYRSSGSLSNVDVQYQAFFYKVNAGSSSSTWNNVRTVEATGYYNCNLGDVDFLSQTGNASAGDKVIIVFWRTGSDRNVTCPTMDEWGALEYTLTAVDVYTSPTQIKINIDPDLSWSFPNTGYVNTNYTSTHNSDDVHSWSWSGTTMYHWYIRYGETINDVNQVNNSDYYWDDATSDLNLPGVAVGTHQWSLAGTYDIDLIIEDECGGTASGTEQILIYYHAPIADITMTPTVPDPNELVSFQWTGTDVDSRITLIDWIIYDTGIYGTTNTTTSGQASGATVPHIMGQGTSWCGTSASGGAFTNPGTHNVAIVIYWHDGFNAQILNYNENFNQGLFTGPTVDFTQVPLKATVSGIVEFTNTSTNTSRVGLGLPGCSEYDWTWTDDGVSTTYSGKPYSYKLIQVPGSANCEVELCADWSDGWVTHTTCISKAVVFETTVIVTEVNCYYNFNIIGTSSDGSVSGYSWEVYFDTASGTGSWDLIWSSPTGMDQNDKKGCFTSEGFYRIVGYVYGTGATTSDYEDLYVSVVCVSEGLISVYPIWNGTGIDDVGGDWIRSGYGVESAAAKHSGTNGLDTTGMDNGHQIIFETPDPVDLNNYDVLFLWVKVNSWSDNKYLSVTFDDFTNKVELNNYINVYNTTDWQKAVIPLEDLGVPTSSVSKLILQAGGATDLYLDDISLSVGDLVYRYLPVCDPDLVAHEEGALHVDVRETGKPSVRPDSADLTPSMRGEIEDLTPAMGSLDLRPGLKAYPEPNNL